jgi:hypothetical protein
MTMLPRTIQQGPDWPLVQTTVEPGGTTTVVLLGAGVELKLRQPPSESGIRTTSSSFFIRSVLLTREPT